jgi:hypothetical protein
MVNESDYRILRPDLFIPTTDKLNQYGFVGTRFKNNYKTADEYFPRLTITPRGGGAGMGTIKDLKIEFSVAKLLFKNNLEEVNIFHEDYAYIILTEKLLEMGVKIYCSPAQFGVSGFDIGKNIFLSKGYFSFEIIQKLNKCEVDRRLDLDNKEYRNSLGTTLQFYSNSHSLVIYDKLADLKKTDKRASDKDRNNLQRDLFEEHEKDEIIRFEVRLRTKAKMRQVLGKLGYNLESIYFKDLFSDLLWKRVLNYYWQGLIVDKNRFLFSKINNADILIDKILKNSPEIKPAEFFRLIGINSLAKEKSLPELRKIYEKKLGGKNWSKFKQEFDKLNEMTEIEDCFGWFEEVDMALRFDKSLITIDKNM